MDDEAFGFGELAYDDNLPYQEDNQNVLENNNFEDNLPSKGKKKKYKRNKKGTKTQQNNPENLKIHENCKRTDDDLSDLLRDYERKKESIFTSESPLDWHLNVGEDEVRTKRRKIEIENVLERVAQRILKARQENSKTTSLNEGISIIQSRVTQNSTKLLKMPPMDGSGWYGINSPDGVFRRYILIKPKNTKKRREINKIDSTEDRIKDLDDYYNLFERMENQKRERLFNNFGDVNMEDDEILEVKNSSRTLWTEKYAPNNFLDLLSDDETNRLVLLWLRLWDGLAFKKKGGVVFWGSLEEKDKKLVEIDHLRGGFVLPKQRILVLHGSSGAGKSSLAVVVARQLGYRPLSIQISEIQNVAELRNRMENAINSIEISSLFLMQKQQQTPKTEEDKPVCFIIEGLELATSDMIQFLCSWTKRSSSNGSILRPVICICSNIWNSPNLKQLRISSLALQVQPCNQKRLKARLLEICRLEGILIDQNQLNEMILTHGTDIRLCLNTLQFMTANAVGTAFSKKNSTPSDDLEQPQKLNTALSVSFIDVLYSIFTLDFHKDSRGIVQSPEQRANTILYLINRLAFEEFTRIQQLIFVNVASVFKLGHEQSTKISKIFISMDLLQSHIQQNQNYFLFRYLPYALISIHFICAMHVSRRLKFDMNTQLFNNFVLPKVEPKIQQTSQIVKIKPNNLPGLLNF
ncbi:unnamed protein product [Meloidogyne enterolobii]|uniref:Uncharacterized protein n=1 Tax=Meloidogyne enterolobii TaxID=390850 RepID=A0ACB1A1T6_MELEN